MIREKKVLLCYILSRIFLISTSNIKNNMISLLFFFHVLQIFWLFNICFSIVSSIAFIVYLAHNLLLNISGYTFHFISFLFTITNICIILLIYMLHNGTFQIYILPVCERQPSNDLISKFSIFLSLTTCHPRKIMVIVSHLITNSLSQLVLS